MRISKRRVGLSVLLLLICLVFAYLVKLNQDGIERAKSWAVAEGAMHNLAVGMSRSEVEQSVQDAWRHYQCGYADIYLFGSHDPSLAAALYLRFDQKGNDEELALIGTVENYQLDEYGDCKIYDKR